MVGRARAIEGLKDCAVLFAPSDHTAIKVKDPAESCFYEGLCVTIMPGYDWIAGVLRMVSPQAPLSSAPCSSQSSGRAMKC